MSTARFFLRLSADAFRGYYDGSVRFVQVQAHDGRQLRFPAHVLRPFLTHAGIEGEFEIEFEDSRLKELRRVAG